MKYNIIFVISLLVIVSLTYGITDINGAFDQRIVSNDFDDYNYVLHGAEINIKYTYADQSGDRLILAVQIPFSSHWKTDMFLYHYGDAYLILKGRLGEPNIRIGRFDIPFGLLKTFDSHFSLLPQIFDRSLGLKKDIGAEVFGYYKMLTYDVSFTHGFNSWNTSRNDRPITARIGLEIEAIKCGISYLNATHSMGGEMKRVGVDVEKNINPIILRAEAMLGDNPEGKGFNIMIDFPFILGVEGRGSGLLWKDDATYQAYGLELRKEISYLTIGAGFIRFRENKNTNNIILQTIVRI